MIVPFLTVTQGFYVEPAVFLCMACQDNRSLRCCPHSSSCGWPTYLYRSSGSMWCAALIDCVYSIAEKDEDSIWMFLLLLHPQIG